MCKERWNFKSYSDLERLEDEISAEIRYLVQFCFDKGAKVLRGLVEFDTRKKLFQKAGQKLTSFLTVTAKKNVTWTDQELVSDLNSGSVTVAPSALGLVECSMENQ